MNEINFEIQDIEKIDLSMDVGVKEIFPPIENLEVNPSKEQQVFNHENSYGYDEVIVNSIPEEYIIPDGTLDVNANGDVDVTMFRTARVGVYTPPKLQTKEVTPTKELQVVGNDEEYDGLDAVVVNPIPNEYIVPSGSLDITENGTKDVTSYAEVNVNIEGKEDLTEELNAYNTELTEQETKIADVIKLLQTKAAGSNSSNLNLFVQEEEPETFEGVWIKDKTITTNSINIISDKMDVVENGKITMPSGVRECGVCKINGDIYYFGGLKNTGETTDAYKYEISTDKFTKLTDVPYSAYGIGVVAYETNIYLFGGRKGSTLYNYVYRYDTTNNTYTKLKNLPISVGQMGISIVDDIVYLFGGTISGGRTNSVYKYNITSDAYTQARNLPQQLNTPAISKIDKYIYIMGGLNSSGGNSSSCYRYDTIEDSYKTLAPLIKASFKPTSVPFNNHIIYIGGTTNSDVPILDIYEYDIANDKHTLISGSGGRGRSEAVEIDGTIYIVGGITTESSYIASISKLLIKSPLVGYTSNDEEILVQTSDTNSPTLLLSSEINLKCGVSAVLHYKPDEDIRRLEAYYGDGTEWIKI